MQPEGRVAAPLPSLACRRCSECEGEDHHWMYVGEADDDGEPLMSCKHCEATRIVEDDD